jgi:sirohydrochlorin cobaltochelatase
MSATASRPALLLIAHGTRNPRGAEELQTLLGLLRERQPAPVAGAWIEEFAGQGAAAAAGELVATGARTIVTLPFLVLGAGHAKTDVPEQVAEVRATFAGLTVVHARVLGLHPALFALAAQRVAAARDAVWGALARDVPDDEALLVTAAGSSDPDANGDLAKAARFLAEGTGHRWAETAYAGVTWPTADVALRRMHAAGARRVVRFGWSLLAGTLGERVDGWAADVARETGLRVADAGRLGPTPAVADAVLDRYAEALAGDVRMNCDLCQYRLPLPGLEDRAGAPSAGGTGGRLHPAVAARRPGSGEGGPAGTR